MPRLRPPYVAQVGLFGRPTLEHNFETLYWVRDLLEKGAEWFASHGRHGRKGLRSFSVSGRVQKPGVKLAPAGITMQELIDEYCGGMLRRAHALRLPAGRRLGRHPAGVAERHPARLRHAAAVRLLHRLGRGHRAVATRTRARDAARNLMRFFEHESLRPVHAVPRRHRQGAGLMEQPTLGRAAAGRPVAGDARRVDLRPGPGGAEPGRCVVKYFPHELRRCTMNAPDDAPSRSLRGIDRRFKLNGARGRGRAGETHHRGRRPRRRRDPAPLLQGRHAARRQLPRLHGRDQGRARAGAVVLPRADRRAWRSRATASAPCSRRRWCWSCCCPTCRRPIVHAATPSSTTGPREARRRQAALRAARAGRAPTCRIRRWPSTSTPASSARAACAPAARSRSTT